jgi:molybdenum cofactor cytidylyltransferase
MKTGALILAAGGATRFGGPKQLLEIDGKTLVDRACHTALGAGCEPVLRVLGARAEEILQRPEPPGVFTLVHENWQAGMGGSLAAGACRLLELEPECEAIFILLADQPMVSAELLERMRELLESRASMVLCDYGESGGPPALFKWPHFPELLELTGDRGAKALAARHPGAVARLPFPDGVWDIDSQVAWEAFLTHRAGPE